MYHELERKSCVGMCVCEARQESVGDDDEHHND